MGLKGKIARKKLFTPQNFNNNLLLERSKLLKKYALNLPDSFDEVHLNIDYPEFGWMDTKVIVNGEEQNVIVISDEDDPFENIKGWLENIVRYRFDFVPFGVKIETDDDDVLMYYEPIFYPTVTLLNPEPYTLYGIFYIYDTIEDKILAEAFCDTKEFVRNVYTDIVDYAERVTKFDSLVEDWIARAYNEEYAKMKDKKDPDIKELFIKKIKSSFIEDFLSDNTSNTRFLVIK